MGPTALSHSPRRVSGDLRGRGLYTLTSESPLRIDSQSSLQVYEGREREREREREKEKDSPVLAERKSVQISTDLNDGERERERESAPSRLDRGSSLSRLRKGFPHVYGPQTSESPPLSPSMSKSPLSKPPMSKSPLSKPPMSKSPLSKPPMSKSPYLSYDVDGDGAISQTDFRLGTLVGREREREGEICGEREIAKAREIAAGEEVWGEKGHEVLGQRVKLHSRRVPYLQDVVRVDPECDGEREIIGSPRRLSTSLRSTSRTQLLSSRRTRGERERERGREREEERWRRERERVDEEQRRKAQKEEEEGDDGEEALAEVQRTQSGLLVSRRSSARLLAGLQGEWIDDPHNTVEEINTERAAPPNSDRPRWQRLPRHASKTSLSLSRRAEDVVKAEETFHHTADLRSTQLLSAAAEREAKENRAFETVGPDLWSEVYREDADGALGGDTDTPPEKPMLRTRSSMVLHRRSSQAFDLSHTECPGSPMSSVRPQTASGEVRIAGCDVRKRLRRLQPRQPAVFGYQKDCVPNVQEFPVPPKFAEQEAGFWEVTQQVDRSTHSLPPRPKTAAALHFTPRNTPKDTPSGHPFGENTEGVEGGEGDEGVDHGFGTTSVISAREVSLRELRRGGEDWVEPTPISTREVTGVRPQTSGARIVPQPPGSCEWTQETYRNSSRNVGGRYRRARLSTMEKAAQGRMPEQFKYVDTGVGQNGPLYSSFTPDRVFPDFPFADYQRLIRKHSRTRTANQKPASDRTVRPATAAPTTHSQSVASPRRSSSGLEQVVSGMERSESGLERAGSGLERSGSGLDHGSELVVTPRSRHGNRTVTRVVPKLDLKELCESLSAQSATSTRDGGGRWRMSHILSRTGSKTCRGEETRRSWSVRSGGFCRARS